jgi:hypothetical protein
LKSKLPKINIDADVSFTINTCDPEDLPKFDETKRLKCPGSLKIKNVIEFVYEKLGLQKYF